MSTSPVSSSRSDYPLRPHSEVPDPALAIDNVPPLAAELPQQEPQLLEPLQPTPPVASFDASATWMADDDDELGDDAVSLPHSPRAAVRQKKLDRLSWALVMLAGAMAVAYLVPMVATKISYAWNLGKQRAEYEVARGGLEDMKLADLSKACQMIAHRVGPSVVHINVAAESTRVSSGQPGWRRSPIHGQGSGVVVDSIKGFILTNHHVVNNVDEIRVSLGDGRVVPAQIVGSDPESDLAVLKVQASGLVAVEWGDSDALEVGALLWALGSPFGLDHSVTFGILSGKRRAGQVGSPYQDFLQTDAAVNPGNSGGPLVDSRGRLVGINTQIVGEAYQGISFAIPSNLAREIYEQLCTNGQITRGWLGVMPVEVTAADAERLKLGQAAGALVADVPVSPTGRPSPAERAGFQVDDVVVRWAGRPINRWTDLFLEVGRTTVGTTVEVVVYRDGQEVPLSVEVDARLLPQEMLE